MNTTDSIILTILLFYFVKGVLNGFWRTLLGPIALIAGSILAVIYFRETHDFLKAILISILAPFFINISLAIILNMLQKTKGQKLTLDPFSRLAGGIMAVSWSGIWIALSLIFLVMTPIERPWFQRLRDNIRASATHSLINDLIGDRIPNPSVSVQKLSDILRDPERYGALQETREYQELINDEALRVILTNEDLMDHVRNNDIKELLSSPDFQALLQNKDLIKKIFALHRKILVLENDPLSLADGEN